MYISKYLFRNEEAINIGNHELIKPNTVQSSKRNKFKYVLKTVHHNLSFNRNALVEVQKATGKFVIANCKTNHMHSILISIMSPVSFRVICSRNHGNNDVHNNLLHLLHLLLVLAEEDGATSLIMCYSNKLLYIAKLADIVKIGIEEFLVWDLYWW